MKNAKTKIVELLYEKAKTKQVVYDNTLATFKILKKVLRKLSKEYNKEIQSSDRRISLEFKDKGEFDAELKVAGDLLVFIMHSNVFEFDKGHGVWKISYVQENTMSSFCGIINIYNFLADSFHYNRPNDTGYLIGRIFINKDKFYFVEGKRQLGFLYNDFGDVKIDKAEIRKIVESAILYSLDFDLFVPRYKDVQVLTVSQMRETINFSQVQTGKRVGFKFYSDDEFVISELDK